VTSENITTPPSTSTSTQPSTELQARLPSDLNCRNSEHYSQGGALANLDCTTGTPLSLLVYSLYPSQSAMETMIRGTSDAVTVIPCPGQGPSPAAWQGGGLNGEVACRILAYPAGPTPQVLWTINSDLVGGWAEGRPNDTIDVVYRWWTSRYQ
jgi:serine/threonine-protein kinase